LKKSHRKKVILGALVLAGAGGGAAALWPAIEARERRHCAAGNGPPSCGASSMGRVRCARRIKADIPVGAGRVIVELPVREGDHVVKDQVLLRIDPFQSQSEVEAARSALLALEAEAQGQAFQIATSEANTARDEFLKKSAEADLLQAETNLARTKEVYQREKSLLDANLISKDQFEITETQRKLNESQVVAAGSRIQQLDAQINATRSSIEFARAVRDCGREARGGGAIFPPQDGRHAAERRSFERRSTE
jgi:multidrug efflux pump subunit AcrA (membrane-fusion protein)